MERVARGSPAPGPAAPATAGMTRAPSNNSLSAPVITPGKMAALQARRESGSSLPGPPRSALAGDPSGQVVQTEILALL